MLCLQTVPSPIPLWHRRSRWPWICRTLILLWSAVASAQTPQIPDSLDPQMIVARSERFSSTHATSLAFDYLLNRENVTGTVRGFLLSSTTLLASSTTKDQIDSYIDLEHRTPGAMRLFMIAEGTLSNALQNDVIGIPGLDNTAATFIGVGGRAVDAEGNRIGLAVGGAYNRQFNQEDVGTGFYGEVAGTTEIDGYQLQLDGRGRWYSVAPRQNGTAHLDLRASRQFEEGGRGDLQVRYNLINTDLYIRRSEQDILQYGGLTYDGLRQRQEERWNLLSSFTYPADEALAFDLALGITGSTIAQQETDEGLPPVSRTPDPFRYSRHNLSMNAGIGGRLTPGHTLLGLRLEYFSGEEENAVDPAASVSEAELRRKRESNRQSDFIAQQLILSGEIDHLLSRYDTLSLNGAIGIYRYDTPDSTNNFDKDEQSIRAQIRYGRSFSSHLSFALLGQVFLTHLVYLFGENSNDNNWNRVFRLAPSVRYVLDDRFINDFQGEVLANYTQYDFEGRTQTIRGRSFREIRLRDSLVVSITPTLVLSAAGELRISERGSFDWTQFAESPLERIRTEGAEAMITTTISTGVSFGAGGKLSRAQTFMASSRGSLEPFSDRTSFGPTAHIAAELSERSRVEFSGWWEHRFEQSALVARAPVMFLTVGIHL